MRPPIWLGVLLVLLAVACLLGPFWWWALFGLSDPVGRAWACTGLALFVAGIAAICVKVAP